MKLLIVFVAVCIVAAQSTPIFETAGDRNIFHDAAANVACAAANILKTAGWMEDDGRPTKKFYDSPSAQECQNIQGDSLCDTADRMLSCLSNKGLVTAATIATLPAGGIGGQILSGKGGGGLPFGRR